MFNGLWKGGILNIFHGLLHENSLKLPQTKRRNFEIKKLFIHAKRNSLENSFLQKTFMTMNKN